MNDLSQGLSGREWQSASAPNVARVVPPASHQPLGNDGPRLACLQDPAARRSATNLAAVLRVMGGPCPAASTSTWRQVVQKALHRVPAALNLEAESGNRKVHPLDSSFWGGIPARMASPEKSVRLGSCQSMDEPSV